MKSYCWILDGALFEFVKGDGGVSENYIIPQSHLNAIDPKEICGADIFVFFRTKTQELLFAVFRINKIEEFEDGSNRGDFLAKVNLSRSYRLISEISSSNAISVDLSDKPFGLTELNKEFINSMNSSISRKVIVTFKAPSVSVINSIKFPKLRGNLANRAKQILEAVVKQSTLEVVSVRHGLGMGPFSNVAIEKFFQVFGKSAPNELLSLISDFDPINNLQNYREKKISEHGGEKQACIPAVDTAITEINLSKIFARKFIASADLQADFSNSLLKTELAEKIHQDILRDICEFLKTNGLIPLGSESIDLCLACDSKIALFEIKSANEENYISQFSKGLMQSLIYKDALEEDGLKVEMAYVIIQKVKGAALEQLMNKLASSLPVKILLYDSTKNWPDRVPNLVELINSFGKKN